MGGEPIVKSVTNNPFDSHPLFGNRQPVADTLGPELLSDAFLCRFLRQISSNRIQLEGGERQSKYLCSALILPLPPLGSDLVNN